jgi:hypothetical protein
VATVPTPYDAVSGTKLTATALDAGLKAPLDWLLGGFPRCHVYDNSTLSIPDSTDTLLTWSGEQYDNDSMHSTASLTSRIVFNTSGLYQVDVHCQLESATYTATAIRGRVNSAESTAGGTAIRYWLYGASVRKPDISFTRQFTAGDYAQFWLFQTSGATRVLTNVAGQEPFGSFATARWLAN